MTGPEAFDLSPEEAAPSLLGWTFGLGECGVRIVETEAYGDQSDEASHARPGRTERNQAMFGTPGILYVYRSYGIHWCVNLVVGPEGQAGAVLLRAGEPIAGIEAMWQRRPAARRITDLASGPGKLCGAIGLDGSSNGDKPALLTAGALVPKGTWLAPPAARIGSVVVGTRVGISRATERRWRFSILDNDHVSTARGA